MILVLTSPIWLCALIAIAACLLIPVAAFGIFLFLGFLMSAFGISCLARGGVALGTGMLGAGLLSLALAALLLFALAWLFIRGLPWAYHGIRNALLTWKEKRREGVSV